MSPRASAAAKDKANGSGLKDVESRLGYAFSDGHLLELALTHSSFVYESRLGRARAHGDTPNEPGSDNEQLEFLGDAVLELAVTELLIQNFPDRTEGELTRMRASLVSRVRLAGLGEELRLGAALRMGKSAEATEGRQRLAVLANSVEAVLGAIYLDSSHATASRPEAGEVALRTVRSLVEERLVRPDLPRIRAALEASPGRGALRDAKSRLQERVQAVGAGKVEYIDIGETGPAHDREFTVQVRLQGGDSSVRALAIGSGGSKKDAQQAAASLALQQWEAKTSGPPGDAFAEPRR